MLYLPIYKFFKFDEANLFLTLTWCNMPNTIITWPPSILKSDPTRLFDPFLSIILPSKRILKKRTYQPNDGLFIKPGIHEWGMECGECRERGKCSLKCRSSEKFSFTDALQNRCSKKISQISQESSCVGASF